MDDAPVPAQHRAVARDEIARPGVALPEQHRIVVAFDEILAFVLLRQIAPAQLARELLDLALVQLAQRENQIRELLLLQARQEIGLVLAGVLSAQELPAAARFVEPGPRVVARGELVEFRALRPGLVDQEAELHPLVAAHARIRRAPRQIFLPEILQDGLFVLLRQRHDPVLDPEPRGDFLGGLQIAGLSRPETAGNPQIRNRHRSVPDAHRQARHPPAVALEQPGRDGRIHAAAQADRYAGLGCRHGVQSTSECAPALLGFARQLRGVARQPPADAARGFAVAVALR